MKNIMISTDQENVAVFIEDGLDISLKEIGAFALGCGIKPNDIYEVRSDELQYYLYSPLWIESNAKLNITKQKAREWLSKASEAELAGLDRMCGIYKTN